MGEPKAAGRACVRVGGLVRAGGRAARAKTARAGGQDRPAALDEASAPTEYSGFRPQFSMQTRWAP